MIVYRSLDEVHLPPSACALGMFDGVHLGHQQVIRQAKTIAEEQDLASAVFSFSNHPQDVLSHTPTRLLSNLEERLALFNELGMDYAIILEFTPALMEVTAKDFVERFLKHHINATHVSVGYNFRFGAKRAGDGPYLEHMGDELGFKTHIVEPVKQENQIISSTVIRSLLTYGDVETANTLLGRPYALTGTVDHGDERGRTLGFPTANLSILEQRLVPGVGTYGGLAIVNHTLYHAVCNIGTGPTFHDPQEPPPKRVEVHLLDYTGPDFYQEPLTFAFLYRIRDEKRFESKEDLIAQIQADCQGLREKQVSLNPEDHPFLVQCGQYHQRQNSPPVNTL